MAEYKKKKKESSINNKKLQQGWIPMTKKMKLTSFTTIIASKLDSIEMTDQ